MSTVIMRRLYVVALSLLVVAAAGTEAYCDVVGAWSVSSLQSAKTKLPGQDWQKTEFNLSETMEFGADGSYKESNGAVGTWIVTDSGKRWMSFSVDIQDYLVIMWHQILLDRGMDGTFELKTYWFEGDQYSWVVESWLHYTGVAHVTSPALMDVKVIGDAKLAGVPLIPSQQ